MEVRRWNTKWWSAVLFCVLFICMTTVTQASSELTFTCQAPYYLGKARDTVTPGERIQALFSIESRSTQDKAADIRVSLPPGFLPEEEYENWQVGRQGEQYYLYRQIKLAGGYSQWFDLIAIQAAASLKEGTYNLTVTVDDTVLQVPVNIAVGEGAVTDAPVELEDIVLPLDREGKMDDRLNRNTLVLRDRSWDYYKNLLRGKGASNQEVEAIHPLGSRAVHPGNNQRRS
ncbi:MAG: hypothetical protein K0Q75_1395 [Anaerospora sp.]|nr:hypothetical protein [Anaerospora sp.]